MTLSPTARTLSFRIRAKETPLRGDPASEIRFPVPTTGTTSQVIFYKKATKLYVYLLCSSTATSPTTYQKIVVDIQPQLGQDTFVTLTADAQETQLYLDAQCRAQLSGSTPRQQLVSGDLVWVKIQDGELTGVGLGTVQETSFPVIFLAFTESKDTRGQAISSISIQSRENNEITTLPLERLIGVQV